MCVGEWVGVSIVCMSVCEAIKRCVLKAYFHGLIFVVSSEHFIIVAYCLDFRGLIFVFGLSVTKITPNEHFPAIR